MKKSQFIFTLYTRNDREYTTAHLTIHERETWNDTGHRELLEIAWQSSASERGRFYGMSMSATSRDHATDFTAKLKRAAKVWAQLFPEKEHSNDDPQSVITRLTEMGIERAAYDGRVSRYVRESEAIDPKLLCYLDDREKYDREGAKSGAGCMVKTLAANEDDARAKLEKEWLETLKKGYARAEQFAAWVGAGRPVRYTQFDKAATFEPIAELLHANAIAAEIAA